jgi:ribosomal protein S25
MNQKQIGVIVLIIGILAAVFVYMAKLKEDASIKLIVQETGSCYLADGTCLHQDRNWTPYILGGIISAALTMLGIYLIVFDKTQAILVQQHHEVSQALKEAKHKDEFNAFLSGFRDDEKAVLKAIREQEGVTQSTLRFRTGMSKASLSLLLKSLEERDIISRRESGKTNNVYLRKKF